MDGSVRAALGLLQAISFNAKVAKVNKACCESLSSAVRRIRPILIKVDKAGIVSGIWRAGVERLSHALEKVHLMMVRFSTMGELQALLESEAMFNQFKSACGDVRIALGGLIQASAETGLDFESDLNRICAQLESISLTCCSASRRLAREVKSAALDILEDRCPQEEGHSRIRNLLYGNCRKVGDTMVQEMQGLKREMSRAKAEKNDQELKVIQQITAALDRNQQEPKDRVDPEPPAEYLCPLSQRIMSDPVTLVETGQTYDRQSIEDWFSSGNRTCPLTKQYVNNEQLTPNYAMKTLAKSWMDVHEVSCHREDNLEGSIKENNMQTRMSGGVDLNTVKVGGVDKREELLRFGDRANHLQARTLLSARISQGTGLDGAMSARRERGAVEPGAAFSARHALESLKSVLGRKTRSLDLPRVGIELPSKVDNKLQEGEEVEEEPASVRGSLESAIPDPLWRSVVGNETPGRERRSSGRMTLSELLQARLNSLKQTPDSRIGMLMMVEQAINKSRESLELGRNVPGSSQSEETMSVKSYESSVDCMSSIASSDSSDEDEYSNDDPEMDEDSLSRASSPENGMSTSSDSTEEIEFDQYLEDFNKPMTTVYHNTSWDQQSFASLTTIAPEGVRVAPSMASTWMTKPRFKRFQVAGGALQGATNALFDENDSDEEDFEMEMQKRCGVSTPMLLQLLKSENEEVTTAAANELALRVYTNPEVRYDLQKTGIVTRLVNLLNGEGGHDVRIAAARTLGTLGDRSDAMKMQIVKSGAFPLLSQLTREGSVRCEDAGNWAMNQLSRQQPDKTMSLASVEISTPVLGKMLMCGTPDVQASAALDLSDRLMKSEAGYEELVTPNIVWTLVELLEHDVPNVQMASATLLSLLVFRDQAVQQQVATKAATVLRLVRLVRTGNESCQIAAVQVLRILAHSNAGAREEMLRRGIIPALVMILSSETPAGGAREAAAWLIGTLGSHSESAHSSVRDSGGVYLLQNLFEVGSPQEIVAASWALQSLLNDPEELGECEVPIPLILGSLDSGPDDVKVASTWELCHLANGSFWSQMEIFNCEGVRVLLGYLRSKPVSEGGQAALATLIRVVQGVPAAPVAVCSEGGISLMVSLLKSSEEVEKKLAAELLTLLAERCPLFQPEVVTQGAVPSLVAMLTDSDETVSTAAYEILVKLVSSELSVVSNSASMMASPRLLEILQGDGPVHGKEAAVNLIETMMESNFDSRQGFAEQGGVSVLLKVMENGETNKVKLAAARAVTKLASKNSEAQSGLAGCGGFGVLVELLQSKSVRNKKTAILEQQRLRLMDQQASRMEAAGDLFCLQGVFAKHATDLADDFNPMARSSPHSSDSTGFFDRRLSSSTLPAVPESSHESDSCSEESPRPEVLKQSVQPISMAAALSSRSKFESPFKGLEMKNMNVPQLVEILRRGEGGGRDAAAFKLRNLAKGNKCTKLELVKAGAVPLMVELLQSKWYK